MNLKLKAIHKRKWHLFYRLFSKKANRLVMLAVLQRLNLAIASQIRILKKLEKANPLLPDLMKALEQQKKLFSKARITGIVSKKYSGTISAMEEDAIHLLKKEQELISLLEKLSEQELPTTKKKAVIRLSKKQAAYAAKLISSVNQSIRGVSYAVGNRKEVQKATKLLLKHLSRLQHTQVYGYLKDDADKIRKAAKTIIQNPSEAKIKSVLAGIYLVAPFSFDATGAVIALRYAAKYANKKSKGLQKKIKAMRDKKKRRLRVFE